MSAIWAAAHLVMIHQGACWPANCSTCYSGFSVCDGAAYSFPARTHAHKLAHNQLNRFDTAAPQGHHDVRIAKSPEHMEHQMNETSGAVVK
jgi:hypothetical protein